jgi:DNA-binding response OmpR family regulator
MNASYDVIVYGNTIIDKAKQYVRVGTEWDHLAPKEFMILMSMIDLAGKPLQPDEGSKREIAVYLCRLRKKLRTIKSNITIRIVRNLGYFIFID